MLVQLIKTISKVVMWYPLSISKWWNEKLFRPESPSRTFFQNFWQVQSCFFCRTWLFIAILKEKITCDFRKISTPCALDSTAWKVSKHGVFSGPYFRAFRLNMERYSVSLCIQSEWGKIRTRKTPYLDTFHAVLRGYIPLRGNSVYVLFISSK